MFYAKLLVNMNGHTCKLLKNVFDDVRTKGKGKYGLTPELFINPGTVYYYDVMYAVGERICNNVDVITYG